MEQEHKPFGRWFIGYFVTTEHFKNVLTLGLVFTYCTIILQGKQLDNEFSLLVGMVLGFYFKKE